MAEDGRPRIQNEFPPTHALILVAIVPTPRDLEIARVFGWYRIPFRFAPKIVQVDYLAFYQPSAFTGIGKNTIETFAQVRGVELTTRKEIIRDEPDHPRAEEEYYKIQLGPLNRINNPIRAGKWKRITFLYTTGDRFSKAKTINDLVVKSEERKILWRSLRERAATFSPTERNDDPEIDLDDNILAMLGELNRIKENPSWYQNC
jgi:hypothetical protein